MASLGWPALPVLDSDPADAAAQFSLDHPNGRTIAAFFLGCIFMNGLHYMTSSRFFQDVLTRIRHALAQLAHRLLSTQTLELPTAQPEKGALPADAHESASVRQYNDHTALIFTLNLCFMLAGLAQFISLLAYANRNGWQTGCAFVVAWGGMASQLARLLGIMILAIELSRIGVRRFELPVVSGVALLGLVFVFAANATNPGTTSVAESVDVAFCYKKRFLPTSLPAALIRVVLEVYLIIRLAILSRSRRRWLSDFSVKTVTIVRACSLLALELMTIVPDSIPTNILADFLPFCAGTVLVLAAFNWKWTMFMPSGRSLVHSRVFVSKPPLTGTSLLMPTPFTLHFPREHRQSAHSWCSHSDHMPPRTARSATPSPLRGSTPTVQSPRTAADGSEHLDSAFSVESAVLATATTAWRRSVHQISLPRTPPGALVLEHPRSAPPMLHGFAGAEPAPFPGRILASQAELAAQLEEEAAALQREVFETSHGPLAPRLARAQKPDALHEAESDHSGDAASLSSGVYGSDILQLTPSQRRADNAIHASPAPTQTSFMLSPDDSHRWTHRFSYAPSVATRATDESDDYDDDVRSAGTTRSRFLSPLDPPPSKVPWIRRTSRLSLASLRSRSREELPTVREASPNPGSAPAHTAPPPSAGGAGRASQRGRRTTFGQPAASVRRSKRATSFSIFAGSEPAPPLPALLSPAGAVAQARRLPPLSIPAPPAAAVPQVEVLPATPQPDGASTLRARALADTLQTKAPASARAPPRAVQLGPGVGRGVGAMKGPRPLPSAWLTGSSWRAPRDAETLSQLSSHRRSASSPSAYSQESQGSSETRRPSV